MLRDQLATSSAPAVSETPDAAIVAASLQAPSRFAELFDRHWPRIHRYCVGRTGDAGEDIAAEVFRVAFADRARFDTEQSDASPWLYGIATNLIRRHFRSHARGERALARLDRERGGDPTDETLDRIEASRLGPELAIALGSMDAADRDALLLHAWADLTYAQIADATGVPVGTVRSRIHRARSRMRTNLDNLPEAHR